ncbi:hypothetical protein ACJZ2D_012027 [Fusarium nematophilum]
MANDPAEKRRKPSAAVSIVAGATAGAVEITPLADDQGKLSSARTLLAGFAAGVAESTFAVTPFESIKTQLIDDKKRERPRMRGFIDGSRVIARERGIRGFFQGFVPSTARQAANSAVRFTSYETLKKQVLQTSDSEKLSSVSTFVVGGLAGIITVYTTMPLNVIKTRMQSLEASKTYRNSLECAASIFKNEGVRTFWSGAVPRLGRLSLSGAIVFTVYEKVTEVLESLGCGGACGLIMVSPTEPQEEAPQTQENTASDDPPRQRRLSRVEHSEQRRPKSLAKACVVCRTKKIRCDAARPRCSACVNQGRECIYRRETPRKRPTFSQIIELQRGQAALKAFIVTLKQSNPDERERLLTSAVDEDGTVRLSLEPEELPLQDHEVSKHSLPQRPHEGANETPIVSSDDELDIAHFISVDDAGKPSSFGPSSALHNPARGETGLSPSRGSATQDNIRNSLIANAALQRHMEYGLARLPSIDGIPTELALHLLNLHWARQHHTFLLTYRPAVMRDLGCSGQYCSNFMLNAIFACSSKFSPRIEVRDNPGDPATAGRRFFRRCDDLLTKDSLLTRPHISTIVGLLLLGSTYNARGETSKGWLYTGYALRMVYDLGLHLDPKQTTDNPEEIEIRRRVFWGAFVCDKLQSLYLGRPVAINLRDSQVSREFMDLYEEKEPFLPPAIASGSSPGLPEGIGDAIPLHSVSTFQQLCMLSKIMITIINRFYVVGATFSNAQNSLQQVDKALQQWRDNLSPDLDFQPWLSPDGAVPRQPPNVMVLHNLYHSLIILVHRPFISDGHLRSAAAPVRSWERCTVAARCITSIALTYKSTFSLSGAPYVLGYSIYVACTIHVRNAASQDHQSGDHLSLLKASLRCLDELCLANPGVAKPANIIRRLVEANRLDLMTEEVHSIDQSSFSFDLDAILNMFPAGQGADAEFAMSGYRMGLDYELPPDPLFGLMDGPAVSFDLESPTMPL